VTRPQSTEELFKQAGGGAPLFFSRDSTVGEFVEGTVLESQPVQAKDYETNALKNWDDGSPMMQLVITLQTELRDPTIEKDDGRRRVFLRWWGSDRQNVIDAVQRQGDQFVRDGAWLRVTFTGYGEQKDRKLNAPKIYGIDYKAPPTATEKLMADGAPTRGVTYSQGGVIGSPTVSQGSQAVVTPVVAPVAPTAVSAAPTDAVNGARAVQVDRKAQIAKVQKLLAAGFSEDEILGMVPGMSAEAVAAIVGL
jgi:hypothetical protein